MRLCHVAGVQPLKSDLTPSCLLQAQLRAPPSLGSQEMEPMPLVPSWLGSFPCGIEVSQNILLPYTDPSPFPPAHISTFQEWSRR